MTLTLADSSPPLAERLGDPALVHNLIRLIDRADQLESLLDQAAVVQQSVPNLLATLIDVADSVAHNASTDGIDLEQRGHGLLQLFLKLTEPETLDAVEQLFADLPKLAAASKLLSDVPNLAATLMDVLDEWIQQMNEEGIDVETSLKQGLHAALWLGSRISETELERLGTLLRSDVLDEHAVDAVALAGSALAKCQKGSCEIETPKRVGMFGMLKALREPNTQRALAFGLRFSQCFGSSLNAKQSTQSRGRLPPAD